jgi:nucleoside-diphosphate-sugar epimerase
LLLDKGKSGEVYNIGGKETMTVGEMLDILKSFARVPIEHIVDTARLRPSDVTLQIPDTTKFFNETGWEPKIPVHQTLHDLLEYHREMLQLKEV